MQIGLWVEGDEGRDVGVPEGGVTAVDEALEVCGRDFGGRDVEGEDSEGKVGEGEGFPSEPVVRERGDF